MEDDRMPLFLINGFLEAGKTAFIKFTLQQDYFQSEGKTLLIVCEEGEEEYEEEFLRRRKQPPCILMRFQSSRRNTWRRLELLYNPERVLMEGTACGTEGLKLPADWDLLPADYHVDGSSFDLYLNNMKPLVGSMVRNTEMLIMNRCDGIEDLDTYRRTLKGMNHQVQIVFEDSGRRDQ